MGGAGVSEAQRGIKLDFRNGLEIGFGDFLRTEKGYRIPRNTLRRVALKAE
jgi:hypothetical protein